jgi:2-polyprenyl-6-hydroxyphenyl methylase / 3-demethylubiquinone-9 3-methyltransferase
MGIKKRNDLELYDRVAEQWWDEQGKFYILQRLNVPRFQYFDRFIPNWQGLKVLDVGCAGGFSCEFMASRGAIVYGIDQSQNCINKAKEHSAQVGLTIDYQYGVAENIPYEDNSFDALICVDVLEHVSDLHKTISEIYRVLKPGGFFGFDTINKNWKSKLIMMNILEDILQEGIHDWEKFIKPEELTVLLKATGFDGIEFKGFDVFGENLLAKAFSYFYYKNTRTLKVSINNDLSVMYIGKAQKI